MGDTGSDRLPESRRISVLLVGASESDRAAILRMCRTFGWDLFEAADLTDGLNSMQAMQFPVVVCDEDLPNGNWKSLLMEIAGLRFRPNLILASRLTNTRIWSEALNLGAYDIVSKPFEASEVRRVVSLAWEAKRYETERAARRKRWRNAQPGPEEGELPLR